jgi:hypothetical protein
MAAKSREAHAFTLADLSLSEKSFSSTVAVSPA